MAENIGSHVDRKVGHVQPSAAEVIRKGQAVLERLECNLRWDVEWRDLILALGAGRDSALRTAQTDKPHGARYRAAMGAWLRCYGFDRLDSGDRSRLFFCYDNLGEIDAWRLALPAGKRAALNSPRTVVAHWKRSLRVRSPEESVEPGAIAIDAMIAQLPKLSPADRARVIATLALTRVDIPAVIIADVVQHAAGQAREVAEQESVALLKFAASIRATMSSRASASLQLEEIGDALRTLARAGGPDWLAQMDLAGSVFRQLGRDRSTKH
jgi:hypothetical protein